MQPPHIKSLFAPFSQVLSDWGHLPSLTGATSLQTGTISIPCTHPSGPFILEHSDESDPRYSGFFIVPHIGLFTTTDEDHHDCPPWQSKHQKQTPPLGHRSPPRHNFAAEQVTAILLSSPSLPFVARGQLLKHPSSSTLLISIKMTPNTCVLSSAFFFFHSTNFLAQLLLPSSIFISDQSAEVPQHIAAATALHMNNTHPAQDCTLSLLHQPAARATIDQHPNCSLLPAGV